MTLVAAGQEIQESEYLLGVALTYFTEQKDESDTVKSRFDFSLLGKYQYEFNDMAALNMDLEIELPGDYKDKATGDVTTKVDYNLTASLGPEFSFSKKVTANLQLAYLMGAGSAKSVDIDVSGFVVGAGLDILF